MLAGGSIWMLDESSCYLCVCVCVCLCAHMSKCASAHGWASNRLLLFRRRWQVFLCPLKEKFFMSPPQVSCLVAVATPQQKEACVWGPVAGRRSGQGRRGCALRVRGREEIKSETQTGWDCVPSTEPRSHPPNLAKIWARRWAGEAELTRKRSG